MMEDGDAHHGNMFLPSVATEKIIEHCRIGNNQIGIFGNHRVLAANGNRDMLERIQADVEGASITAGCFLNCPSTKQFSQGSAHGWEVCSC